MPSTGLDLRGSATFNSPEGVGADANLSLSFRSAPTRLSVGVAGPLELPTLITTSGPAERFVLIHPFWSGEAVLAVTSDGFAGTTYYVDTFQTARRPQRVIDLARGGSLNPSAN